MVMISRTLKLKPNAEQIARLDEWMRISAAAWNWALSRYMHHEREREQAMRETPPPPWYPGARTPIAMRDFPGAAPTYYSLTRETRGHAVRVGMRAQSFDEVIRAVSDAWAAYKSGKKGRPRWKGKRNRLASIPMRQHRVALRFEDRSHLRIPGIGVVKIRPQRDFPAGRLVCGRIQSTPRGWYFTVVVDAEPKAIPLVGHEPVGIDLGYSTLATLSTGEKVEHPRELQRLAARLAQVHRGRNYRLLGRLQQRLGNARRKRNHTVSRDLVSRFGAIYVSKDNLSGLQRMMGKSVLSAGHGALRTMLASKCRQAGRVYVEVPSPNSTRTCSSCGCLAGPIGMRGLSVREWVCACGARHDRDVNAAVNTLILGAVLAHESPRERASEISGHR